MTALHYTALTDVGPARKNNQDSGYASAQLLVLADGMGGQAAGDLASAVAVQTVRRLDPAPEGDVLEALAGAVHRANDRLSELVDEDASNEGMGTTLIAMLLEHADADGLRLGTAHVGDSRAYLLHDGRLTQVTADHTFVQSLVDEGRISATEARSHPHRSLILRALQGGHSVEPDLYRLSLIVGDRVLLCSDGLSDYVDPEDIADALGADTIELAAAGLVRLALDAGTTDNVTVVIGEVVPDHEDVGGAPVLVGAATSQPGPASRLGATGTLPAVEGDEDGGAASGDDAEDLEALRYAPRSYRRNRWLVRTLALVVLALVVGFGVNWAYGWSQTKYYVGESGGTVAIFRGLPQEVAGLDLSELHHDTELMVDDLPEYSQTQVQEGIEADDLAEAANKLDELRRLAADCRSGGKASAECSDDGSSTDPTPTTTPTPTRTTPTRTTPTRTTPTRTTPTRTTPTNGGGTGSGGGSGTGAGGSGTR